MNKITEQTNKDEIITSAVECIDSQQQELITLKHQQSLLFWLVGLLAGYILLVSA